MTIRPPAGSKLPEGPCDVLYLSSCGGHLVQLLKIASHIDKTNSIFVINDRTDLDSIMQGRTVQITHAERNWKQFLNLIEAFQVVLRYRPKVILSTGAAPAVPFSIVGRMFGAHIVFVESFSRITAPSLTGKLMYHIAHDFFVQWPKLKERFPKAHFHGGLL